MERVLKILEGNGKPGLLREFADHKGIIERFMAVWESREKDKMIFDDRQSKKQTAIIAVVSVFIALAMLIIAVLGYEHAVGHAILTPIQHQSGEIYNAQVLKHYDSSYF